MKSGITVIAIQHAKPDCIDRLIQLNLEALVSSIRQAKGLINLDVHQDLSDPTKIMLYENWATKADWEAYHADRPSLGQHFFNEAEALYAQPPIVHLYSMLSNLVP